MIDPSATWDEIARFHESSLVTTGSLHGNIREQQLVKKFLENVSLEVLFQVLQTVSDEDREDKVNVVCACLDRVLGCDTNGMFYQTEMIPFILAGLRHYERRARILTVNQLIAHLKNVPTAEQATRLANPSILEAMCAILADEEVEMASKAAQVLDLLARTKQSELYKPVIDVLNATIHATDVTQSSVEFMRYIDTLARIAEQNDQHMQYAIASQAIDVVLKCLQSSDKLFVMNVIDLIPTLCKNRSGIQHIFESGTIQTLLGMAPDPLIGDSALRLVGEISAAAAKLNVASWNWNDPMLSKSFLSTIETKLQGTDELEQIAAMDAIAAFGSSSEKELHLLLQHKHICKLWLDLARSTKMPLKVNCLHAVSRILTEPTRVNRPDGQIPDENAHIWGLNERLFQALGEHHRHSTIALLMEMLRQPWEEIRTAVYTLFRAVGAQNNDWGMRGFLSYGGFFEFLMDRTTEPTKETREWKFAVVDAIVSSPYLTKLDTLVISQLQQHVLKGPYVGKMSAEMAMEAM